MIVYVNCLLFMIANVYMQVKQRKFLTSMNMLLYYNKGISSYIALFCRGYPFTNSVVLQFGVRIKVPFTGLLFLNALKIAELCHI